jgi:hypothetical protein
VIALHTDELKIAAALSDAEPLQEELKDFQRQVSDAGRATYNARVGGARRLDRSRNSVVIFEEQAN